MSEKTGKPRSFRPTQRNEERLVLAEQLGLNVAQILNTLMDEYWDDYSMLVLDQRAKAYQKIVEEYSEIRKTKKQLVPVS